MKPEFDTAVPQQPVSPVTWLEGSVTTPKGFTAGGLFCGLRRKQLDLGWIYSDVPAAAAAVYTTNRFQAAPLKVTQASMAVERRLQAIVANSGNANACTGEQGLADAYQMRSELSRKLQVPEHFVAVASTGVIGQYLPMKLVLAGIQAIDNQGPDAAAERFAQAIMTTDTTEKHAAVQLHVNGKQVTIAGAAKGSGMVHPNMATMLAFLTTDAVISSAALESALKQVTKATFNMITVDGDTSTNDMVLALANGQADHAMLHPEHPDWESFVQGLTMVCESLGKQIVRDGEGATKLVEVEVQGGVSKDSAVRLAKTIMGSNLVKTAVFGGDANWGRIICAIGYSGEPFAEDKVEIWLGPIQVVEQSLPVAFDEVKAAAYLEQDTVKIFVNLHAGTGEAVTWGCDLSYEYVRINASYRT